MFKFLIPNRKEKLALTLELDADRRNSVITKVKTQLELELIDWCDDIIVECWKGKEMGYQVKDVYLVKARLKDLESIHGTEHIPISASAECNAPNIIINILNRLYMWNNGFGKFSPGNKVLKIGNMFYIEFWPEDQMAYDERFNKLIKKYS